MKRLIIFLFIFALNLSLFGQSTFSKIYDIDPSALRNYFKDIEIVNDHIFIASVQACPKDGVFPECTVLSKFKLNGEKIKSIINDTIFSVVGGENRLSVNNDNNLFFSCHGINGNFNNTLLYKYDTNLNVQNIYSYPKESDGNNIDNQGNVFIGQNQFLYGMMRNQPNSVNEVQIIKTDENQLVEWSKYYTFGDSNYEVHGLQSTPDNNLLFLLWNEPRDIFENAYRSIVKMNLDGDTINSMRFDDISDQPNSILVAKDGSTYFSSRRDPRSYYDTSIGRINKLNANMTDIEWSLILPNDPLVDGHIYKITDYTEAQNGDIIACGQVWENSDSSPGGDIQSTWNGFIIRIEPDSNIKWLRIYRNLNHLNSQENFGKFRPSVLIKVKELDSGHIVAGGEVYVNTSQLSNLDELETEAFHLWLLSVDENGCLDDIECDQINYLTSNSNSELPQSSYRVFPNPTSDFINLNSTLPFKYSIYNFNGQSIKEGDAFSTIDVSHLNQGQYILKVVQKDLIHNYKFLKL